MNPRAWAGLRAGEHGRALAQVARKHRGRSSAGSGPARSSSGTRSPSVLPSTDHQDGPPVAQHLGHDRREGADPCCKLGSRTMCVVETGHDRQGRGPPTRRGWYRVGSWRWGPPAVKPCLDPAANSEAVAVVSVGMQRARGRPRYGPGTWAGATRPGPLSAHRSPS